MPRLLWACLAATLAASLIAPPAQAQSTLVSNLGEDREGASNAISAQAFTTGPNLKGYTVTEVKVEKGTGAGPFKVHLARSRSQINDEPNLSAARLVTLTPPSSFPQNSVLTFTAPAHTTLAPSTTYHVVVSGDTLTTSPGNIQLTDSRDEDNGGARGWSIEDTRRRRDEGATSWRKTTQGRLRIQINGTFDGHTPPTVYRGIPDQRTQAGTAFAYRFPRNAFADLDGVNTLTYAATKGDGSPLPGWLTFTAATRTFSGTPAEADGGRLRVKVTATDGTDSVSTSFKLVVNRPAQGKPVIEGTVRLGETLTVDVSGITDADGTKRLSNGVFGVLWYVEAKAAHPNIVWILGTKHSVTLTNEALKGRRIFARVTFRDGFGSVERVQSERTGPVAPQQLSISGGAVLSGSLCTYTFPAGDGCTAEASARDVGVPLVVKTSDGNVDVTSQTTFTVTNPSRLVRHDEFGHLQQANYQFAISAGGQLRTVPGKTYPHVDAPWCTGTASGTGHRCDPTTIMTSSWTLDPVYVEVTAETNGMRGTHRIPVFVTKHPDAVRVWAPNDLRCNGEPCYGRALAPGQTMYGSGGAQSNVRPRSGESRELTAQFKKVPEEHDGQTEFTVLIELSEPVLKSENAMRDHVVKVENGSATRAELVTGRNDQWEVTIAPKDDRDTRVKVGGEGGCEDPGTLCTPTGEQPAAPIVGTIEGPGARPLTVELVNVPATHDGQIEFSLELKFSEAPHGIATQAIAEVIEVHGANKGAIQPVNGSAAHLALSLTPTGGGPVNVTVPPTLACTDPAALCTESGGRLEVGASIEIPGPDGPAELTAEWENVPPEHNGQALFELHLVFSEAPAGVRNRNIKAAIQITGGTVKHVRVVDGDDRRRRIGVQPSGQGPVTLALEPTTDCADANALCTAAGGKIERRFETTVPGLIAISVVDAEVEEAQGAVLEFEVTLDRARIGQWVSVDYASEDGTATAGEDYTAVSGSVLFAPGETAKTVEVPVIDDAHDEGSETMVLRLSNPVGARIADGEATGTIHNTDHMPKAWLARFGRTVAEQMFEAAEDRTRGRPQAGARATVAGVPIGAGSTPEETEEGLDALSRWTGEAPLEPSAMWLTGRALLSGSSFALTAGGGAPGAGVGSVWGRGAITRFDGREDELVLDGEVASAMLGADFAQGRWSAGAMLSHSRGDGSYTENADGGTVESKLTGLYPYGRYALGERLTLWGVAGYGAGTLGLTPNDQATIETDIDLLMGGVGLRGVVVEAGPEGGPEIALTSDALGVRTTWAAVRASAGGGGNLAGGDAATTRIRLGVEGAWHGLKLGTGRLAPRLELGLRRDGGDAETGFGLGVEGALGWSDPARGLNASVSARGLLSHEAHGLRDRGFAGVVSYDPRPQSDRGLALTLRQTVGDAAEGGAQVLLGRTTLEGLGTGDDENARRLEATLGYGLPAFGGRLTATPAVTFGLSDAARDYRAGWRLGLSRSDRTSAELRLDARRREAARADTAPEHAVGLALEARW